MESVTQAIPVPRTDAASASAGGFVSAAIETTKPGITRLVTMTALVGYGLTWARYASLSDAADWRTAGLGALWCGLGTALSAAGANALNQWLEAPHDAHMRRTSTRPIPSGRLPGTTVAWLGGASAVAGVAVLAALCGVTAALVALACVVSYVYVYTPLKRHTVWNTLVGTLPGALPAVIGSAAAVRVVAHADGPATALEPLGLALFALLTVWQIPHFMAIAWMYAGEYSKAGFRMLPEHDEGGTKTAAVMVVTAVLLVPAALSPALAAPELLGWPYRVLALVSGLGYVWLAVRFAQRRERGRARAVFFGSIAHLPLLLIALVVESAARVLL
jgi:protoheme IX farnesyltransferase